MIRRRLETYLKLIRIQIRSQIQYPFSFLFDIFTNGISLLIFFLSLSLVLTRFDNVGGWRLGEIAFLWGTAEISFGLMDMIFSGFDPDSFSTMVRQGTLDQMLLRPTNITIQVFGSRFMMRRLGRIAEGLIIFTISQVLSPVIWTLPRLLFYPIVIISQILFFGGLFMVGSTITFWTIERIEAMNILTYGGNEMISYPMHIYPDWMIKFFTYLIPLIFINYYPALFFLGKPDPFGMPSFTPFLAPLAGLAVFLASLWFWKFGLRYYQGTGS